MYDKDRDTDASERSRDPKPAVSRPKNDYGRADIVFPERIYGRMSHHPRQVAKRLSPTAHARTTFSSESAGCGKLC